jgi:hypothetical protein
MEHLIPDMGPQEFFAHMQGLYNIVESDPEKARAEAERAMCAILESMGYTEGVRLYRQMVSLYL